MYARSHLKNYGLNLFLASSFIFRFANSRIWRDDYFQVSATEFQLLSDPDYKHAKRDWTRRSLCRDSCSVRILLFQAKHQSFASRNTKICRNLRVGHQSERDAHAGKFRVPNSAARISPIPAHLGHKPQTPLGSPFVIADSVLYKLLTSN
jgi:hypothetical protein